MPCASLWVGMSVCRWKFLVIGCRFCCFYFSHSSSKGRSVIVLVLWWFFQCSSDTSTVVLQQRPKNSVEVMSSTQRSDGRSNVLEKKMENGEDVADNSPSCFGSTKYEFDRRTILVAISNNKINSIISLLLRACDDACLRDATCQRPDHRFFG